MSSSITTLYSRIATPQIRATLIALLAFFLPFERIPSLDVLGVTIRISQFIAVALVFVSVGAIFSFYKDKPHLPRLLLPAFLGSYAISMLLASDFKRATMVFVFTVFVALAASAIAATVTADQLPRIEKYLFIATAVVLTFGFYQYLGDVLSINPAFTGLRSIYTKEIFGFPRIQSTALEPLYYGSFLLIPYCILLAKRLVQPRSVTKFHTILLVVIVSQILLTVSRGSIYSGILATLVLLGGLLLMKKTSLAQIGKTISLLVIGVVLGLLLTWIPAYFIKDAKLDAGAKTEKLLDQAGNLNSQDDRVRNRKLAIEAAADKPIFGIGPGGFSQYAVERYPIYAPVTPVIVNNEPLELAAEAGIVGFVLFVLFVGWTYVKAAMRYFSNKFKHNAASYWVPAVLVYVIALAVQYQTFSTLYVMHVWVVIGLLMAFGRKKQV